MNVTWRGKTYVGTLLDCAKHTNQWSAPRLVLLLGREEKLGRLFHQSPIFYNNVFLFISLTTLGTLTEFLTKITTHYKGAF